MPVVAVPGAIAPVAASPWRSVFAIDARSLGLFRIVLGLFLIVDLAMRSSDLATFYSDEGILPRLSRILLYELTDTNGQKYWLSLHLISGAVWFQGLLFLVSGAFAFMLMVGYRTRLSAVASFILIASLQSRTPVILDGGDTLIRVLLFWSIFLPLNARFSVDRLLRPEPPAPADVHNLASFALLTQVGYVYVFGAIQKSDPIWRSEYTALYYALSLECFATSIGTSLLQYQTLLKVLTFTTWWLEMIGPLLLLIPYGNRWLRLAMVLSFWGFHLGTDLTLHLSLFPFIGCLAWIPFLPASVWERSQWPGRWLVPLVGRIVGPLRRLCEALVPSARPWLASPEGVRPRLGWFSFCFLAFLWVYTLVWNIREVNAWVGRRAMPASMNVVGRLLRIDQDWKLFAPYPSKDDGWFVMKGILRNGEEVNLWQADQPLPWEKPAWVADTYPDRRWRKYLQNLWSSDYERFRRYFAVWLASRWQDEQARNQPNRMVKQVELYYMLKVTPPPGQPMPTPTREMVLSQPIGP